VPGGSSGGTATAVNASFAVLGLGTETGRSIHNPAGFQSLVGIRPSQGLVPIDGIAPLNGTYRDVAGPITKTVYDAAVTLDVLAGPSGRDRLSANSEIPLGGYTSKLSTSALVGARVGYFDNGFLPVFQTVNGVRTATFRNTDAPTAALYETAINVIDAQGADIIVATSSATPGSTTTAPSPRCPQPGVRPVHLPPAAGRERRVQHDRGVHRARERRPQRPRQLAQDSAASPRHERQPSTR
jgi:Asp-tRNA(Asn)/Glu-tRNA(Gln) amidotransferase A subunit family amidase